MRSRLTVVLVSLLVATPAVIFWLWLVIAAARTAKLCPEGCWCDTGRYYVSCYKSSLNNIPLIFPTNTRKLVFDENNITSLEKDIFIKRGLNELEYLRINYCGLERIQLGAFNGLTNLTALLMGHNNISKIIPGTFENVSRLNTLELEYNRIRHLEVDVFRGLINLESIFLFKNKLQYLHPDTFVALPNLKYIALWGNFNLQVPTGRHFINSQSLSGLDISGCSVSSVSVETFAKVSALEQLQLRYNYLRSVDINILKALPKLSILDLSGNPLQCDCQLQEVWRWCQEHNIETAYYGEPPKCDTPSEVQGIWWGVLEKGQCLQGDMYYYGDYKNTSYSYTPMYELDSYEYHESLLRQLQAPLYAVPFIFGTTGNVILLIIITCNKDMRTVPNMYILNLAISDIIYLMVHFAEACANRISDTWKYGDFMCRFLPFCRRLSVGLSAYSLAVLSIQRYRVTVNPLHVRVSSQPTRRDIAATICGMWIVAALFALPSALSKRLCFLCWTPNCGNYYQHVVVFELLVSCVLPLCVIAFSYIMTARHLVKSARPISEGTQSPQLNTRTNTAKIVLGLTAVFIITYGPYHIFWVYFFWTDRWTKWIDWRVETEYVSTLSTCLLLINSCLNPVALCCTSLDFRRQFKRYLTCCCKANPTATDIELTRRNRV